MPVAVPGLRCTAARCTAPGTRGQTAAFPRHHRLL